MAAFVAGELSVDQVSVVARHVPTECEAQAADLARLATVSQLRRSLSRYQFHPEPAQIRYSPNRTPAGCQAGTTLRVGGGCGPAWNPTKAPSWPRRWPKPETPCSGPEDPHVTGPEALVEMAERSLDAIDKPHPARRLPGGDPRRGRRRPPPRRPRPARRLAPAHPV